MDYYGDRGVVILSFFTVFRFCHCVLNVKGVLKCFNWRMFLNMLNEDQLKKTY